MSTDIKYSLFLRVEGNTISNTILQTKNEVQALTDSGKKKKKHQSVIPVLNQESELL